MIWNLSEKLAQLASIDGYQLEYPNRAAALFRSPLRNRRVNSRGGFTQREIEAAALRCRMRYSSDGVVLESQQVVDDFFEKTRSFFGKKRS